MKRRQRASLVVFLLLLYAFSYNGGGWNQNARYDSIFAFVEPGPNQYTFRIDDFLTDPSRGRNTGDWARSPVDGHYYANKAPGTTFLGVPFYALLHTVEAACGGDPQGFALGLANAYLLNLLITVLPLVLSAPSFTVCARRLGSPPGEAFFLTLFLYCGSLFLPYSSQLWGHPTAAACVVFALRFATGDRPRDDCLCGLFAGLAVLTDYGAAIPAVALVAFVGHRRGWRSLRGLLLGALGPALVFAAFHQVCFGSPFTLASSYSNPAFLDADRVGSLFGPVDPSAMWGLTFGLERGLLVSTPLLLLTPLCAWLSLRRGEHRRVALCVAVALGLLLVNASFNGWRAGLSFGARYQIVALPFWTLLLIGVGSEGRLRAVACVLGGLSALNMVVGLLATPLASGLPQAYAKVVTFLFGGRFPSMLVMRFERFFALTDLFTSAERCEPAFNLGELLGLSGGWSLLPLLALTLAYAWAQRATRA